jgi:hypothetical protein
MVIAPAVDIQPKVSSIGQNSEEITYTFTYTYTYMYTCTYTVPVSVLVCIRIYFLYIYSMYIKLALDRWIGTGTGIIIDTISRSCLPPIVSILL